MKKIVGVLSVYALGLLMTPMLPSAFAAYPEKPIRMIVPFPAGGATDLMGRALGKLLAEQMHQSVVIDNRGGAGGSIGAEIAARSTPDGYTLLFGTMGTLTINPAIYPKLNYQTLRDFAPISLTYTTPRILVVHPSVAAKNVRELIALAKSKPGVLTFGSAGYGSSSHLTGELFKSSAGINLTHVPYKGTSAAVIDLIAGRISMAFDSPAIYVPYVRNGKLRALGVSSLKRLSMIPDIPTIAESGLPGFEVSNWLGALAPARTPKDIVMRLQSEIAKAMTDSETKQQLLVAGIETTSSSPEQFTAFIKSETVKWAALVKRSRAKID